MSQHTDTAMVYNFFSRTPKAMILYVSRASCASQWMESKMKLTQLALVTALALS